MNLISTTSGQGWRDPAETATFRVSSLFLFRSDALMVRRSPLILAVPGLSATFPHWLWLHCSGSFRTCQIHFLYPGLSTFLFCFFWWILASFFSFLPQVKWRKDFHHPGNFLLSSKKILTLPLEMWYLNWTQHTSHGWTGVKGARWPPLPIWTSFMEAEIASSWAASFYSGLCISLWSLKICDPFLSPHFSSIRKCLLKQGHGIIFYVTCFII